MQNRSLSGKTSLGLVFLATMLLLPTSLLACDTCGGEKTGSVVATVGDLTVTRADVEEHAAAELAPLDQQRDEILRRHLDELVTERLIALEAGARELTPDELADEIQASTPAVTDQDVRGFYDQNRQRIRQPFENVASDVRRHLESQRIADARRSFVAGLADRYAVDLDWDPYRLPVASDDAPFKGPADATVDVVVFSDFQCPWCSRFAPGLEELAERYHEDVRLSYRHLPLRSIHPQAQAAAEASICADEQGAFWTLHDELFARQKELASLDWIELAKSLDLDGEKFGQCLASERPREIIASDVEAAQTFGVSSTPSVFVNGRKVPLKAGQSIADQLAVVVDDELGR